MDSVGTVPLGKRSDAIRGLVEGKPNDAIAHELGVPSDQVERLRNDVALGLQLSEPAEARIAQTVGDVAVKVISVYFDKHKEASKDHVELLTKQTKLALWVLAIVVAGILGVVGMVGYYKPEILQNALLIVAGLAYLLVAGGGEGGSVLSKLFKKLLT